MMVWVETLAGHLITHHGGDAQGHSSSMVRHRHLVGIVKIAGSEGQRADSSEWKPLKIVRSGREATLVINQTALGGGSGPVMPRM